VRSQRANPLSISSQSSFIVFVSSRQIKRPHASGLFAAKLNHRPAHY
jgi:hypothetical protein